MVSIMSREMQDILVNLCRVPPPSPPPHRLQAKPMEVRATRDFSESRKLALAANDPVTVIEHGWVRERRENTLTRNNEPLLR